MNQNIVLKINLYGASGLPTSETVVKQALADCLGHIAFAMGQGFMSGEIMCPNNLQCDWQVGSGVPFPVDGGP